jgi:XRE family transcriptional regulator, stress-response regulator
LLTTTCHDGQEGGPAVITLRRFVGDALRRQRLHQQRTLREVSSSARVSLGYLSEVERGQKEPSSELLASICGALDVPLSRLLREVSDELALAELTATPVAPTPAQPAGGAVTDSVASAPGSAVVVAA